jgi:hypothetical protein
MSELLVDVVYVVIAIVLIAGFVAWLYVAAGSERAGVPTPPPRPTHSRRAQRISRPVHHWPHLERRRRLRRAGLTFDPQKSRSLGAKGE